jgi:hypothetical protein
LKKITIILCYLILSIFAAVILFSLTYFPKSETILLNEKIWIGVLFIGVCIFGITIAIKPGWYRRIISYRRIVKSNNIKKPKIRYSGHHPDCIIFRNHKINIGEKTFCAGCLGLSLGSLISIIFLSAYFLVSLQTSDIFLYFIPIGFIIIGLNYLEILYSKRNAGIHVVSNIFLIISFLIITISIFQFTGNVIFGFIGILFSFLWLDTRVQLSSWQHNRICRKCKNSCKVY